MVEEMVPPMMRQQDRLTKVRQTTWSDTAASLLPAVEALTDQLHFIRHQPDLQVIRTELLWQADKGQWLMNVLAEYSSQDDLMASPLVVVDDE